MKINPGLKLVNRRNFIDYMEGKNIHPINVEISPSGICNASCDCCFYKDKQSGQMIDRDVLRTALKDMTVWTKEDNPEDRVRSITWTGGGEPTLHKDFLDFTTLAKRVGLKQGLITNALGKINYVPEHFEWIRVSKTNRPFNLENLVALRSKAKSMGLCINYSGNEEEVAEALRIGEKVGVDYVQVRPALNTGGKKTFVEEPKIEHPLLSVSHSKFSEARVDRHYTECEGFHFVPFIWEDGKVDVCGYQRGNPAYNLGDLNKAGFRDIMRNAPKYVDAIPSCQICCKLHEINSTIATSRKLEDLDFP